jgi:catechol 2,3-dioxygenase-like lactoylglutathione lyase family enzyme
VVIKTDPFKRGSVARPNLLAMKPQVHFITLGVDDVAAARRFYVDGLGWEPLMDLPGDIFFLQVGHGLVLSMFGKDALEADIGTGQAGASAASLPFTLAHNVDSEADVERVMAEAREAGATILKPAQRAEFGGFHGYFADPSGFRWEVCFNPGWSVAADGAVTMSAVEG